MNKGWFALVLLSCVPLIAHAEMVAVTNEKGECFFVEANSLSEVATKVSKFEKHGKSKRLLIEMDLENQKVSSWDEPAQGEVWDLYAKKHGGYLGNPRNYHAPVTVQEKGDVRYIIVTLANRSLISIARSKETLEMAGDRIDHLHPLKFLHIVFTDEELKVGIRNIRSRSLIWHDFMGGMKESFITEHSHGNIKHEHVHHLAESVGIDVGLIMPAVQAQSWEELVDIMIVHVPRHGDHDRFDS